MNFYTTLSYCNTFGISLTVVYGILFICKYIILGILKRNKWLNTQTFGFNIFRVSRNNSDSGRHNIWSLGDV